MSDNYSEISSKAKSLVESKPTEALDLYLKLWNECNEGFNAWDAFFLVKSARKAPVKELNKLIEIVEKYKEEEKVSGLFGWYVFDKYVKGKNHTDILNSESTIKKMTELCHQKNMREDNSYPCPYTIAVFSLIDAFANNLFNASSIEAYLSLLNSDFLSKTPRSINTEKRGDVELSSDLEKYYSLLTKAYLISEKSELCIEKCNEGLESINKFHNNNDLWLKMRIALSHSQLGELDNSESLLLELVKSKAGNDKWFLYRDLAELKYKQEKFTESYSYSVEAALLGNEPHFLINLYLLQARVLSKLKRLDEAKIYAELIASVLKEHGWKHKQEYQKLIQHFEIVIDDSPSLKSVHRTAVKEWMKEKYKNRKTINGKVDKIHGNGKSGFIKSGNGETFFFGKSDLLKRYRNLDELLNATVSFYEGKSTGKSKSAEAVEVIKMEVKKLDGYVGKEYIGIINNIVDFGIFVNKIADGNHGLVHRKNLPSNFAEQYEKGQKLKVVVSAITNKKQIELKLVNE